MCHVVHLHTHTHTVEYEHILHAQNYIVLHSQPIIILCLDGTQYTHTHTHSLVHACAIALNVCDGDVEVVFCVCFFLNAFVIVGRNNPSAG